MTSQEVKNKLDGVGCGFCLPKWTQVTIIYQRNDTFLSPPQHIKFH